MVADSSVDALDSAGLAALARRVLDNLAIVIQAPEQILELAVICLLAEGHLIIEDLPGTGKTTLAKALARSLAVDFARVQFTPDLLPSDITGVNVFDQASGRFEFRQGPVFANVLLIDEINRASPKTQSALLECMQEHQVTVDGTSYQLSLPFLVLATQNPIEYEGTYPLPEAQLDRFMLRLSLGYPAAQTESKLLIEQASSNPLASLGPVASAEEVLRAMIVVKRIFVDPLVSDYVVALLSATRTDERLLLGGSPRAGIALLSAAKARAAVHQRDYVEPEDVQELAPWVLAHRLILAPEARAQGLSDSDLVRELVGRVAVPR